MEKANDSTAIVEEFKKYLIADGKSPSTVESYVGDAAGFTAWLEERGQAFTGNMRRLFITNYRTHLVEEGFEAATVNKKVSSLQSFNGFLNDEGCMTERTVDIKKDKVRLAQGSEKEVKVLME